MNRLKSTLLCLALLVSLSGAPASAGCGATTFQPISPFVPRGTTHNAYSLSDPAGQQTAIFDIQWGGALASLKLSGVEMVWGNATGGMVQPALHTFPVTSSQDYNPTQAGDNKNLGSTVVGVNCIDSNDLMIITGGVLDYNLGRGGYIVANAVKNNSVSTGSYATPYTVVTVASFVANPGGSPSYYLRLQQTIANISSSESFPWGFELAGYVPYNFTNFVRFPANCTDTTFCSSGSTPQLVGGLYPNSGLTGGTAFYISPQTYWVSTTGTFVSFGTDDINKNQSTHLFDDSWGLGPGTSRTFAWYVMVGSWSQALAFAQTH
ncbi:MAG TPA: hypothetical protein VIA62_17890 [Thermoanaerobaculia bacterium]|nr:hypothetical protein [Thermoanaerobaculia bacterium]